MTRGIFGVYRGGSGLGVGVGVWGAGGAHRGAYIGRSIRGIVGGMAGPDVPLGARVISFPATLDDLPAESRVAIMKSASPGEGKSGEAGSGGVGYRSEEPNAGRAFALVDGNSPGRLPKYCPSTYRTTTGQERRVFCSCTAIDEIDEARVKRGIWSPLNLHEDAQQHKSITRFEKSQGIASWAWRRENRVQVAMNTVYNRAVPCLGYHTVF